MKVEVIIPKKDFSGTEFAYRARRIARIAQYEAWLRERGICYSSDYMNSGKFFYLPEKYIMEEEDAVAFRLRFGL
jgi:hypothetical protein